MFDRDVLALQMGAALIEPNEFLASLLNRFKLVDFWAKYVFLQLEKVLNFFCSLFKGQS